MKTNKISIIGAGFVGSATAFSLMLNKVASDIVMVDVNKEKAMGEAMDIHHGTVLISPVDVTSGDIKDTASSDIIIIAAGAAQKPGETRLDLVNKNIDIYETLIPELVKYSPNTILLVVSNPVDILTYVTYKLSGLPKNRVIGSGTVLDTARFRTALARAFDVDARNIHASIIGEHGDSEIATWSRASIAGMTIDEYFKAKHVNVDPNLKENIAKEVKDAAYEIIKLKGYTNYGVAVAVTKICTAILRDERAILTTSNYIESFHGVKDIFLSVPAIIGRNGVEQVLEIPLSKEEEKAFSDSGKIIKKIIEESRLK